MNTPRIVIGLFMAVLLAACAREPKIKPGMYETVASWQYPMYRQYFDGQEPVGTGVSLQLKEDSTYEYASFQMNVSGRWTVISDTLYLHCDSVYLSHEIPLEEYGKMPWTCPARDYSFVIGKEMFYRHYRNPDGIESVMILEKVHSMP